MREQIPVFLIIKKNIDPNDPLEKEAKDKRWEEFEYVHSKKWESGKNFISCYFRRFKIKRNTGYGWNYWYDIDLFLDLNEIHINKEKQTRPMILEDEPTIKYGCWEIVRKLQGISKQESTFKKLSGKDKKIIQEAISFFNNYSEM